ncbi:hypothetical protein [Planomonospora sp. ID82291]|uniref:hypothetical protein n=1 Tax=Planomonospora sp. ID82291 TaxID=2738136 RepID=UPI0018C42710|nr:hypothetical protein [Planomonospora sp. ID82291]MBG0813538.1 hypothetical protein [Planomonospora sp. ID82291]
MNTAIGTGFATVHESAVEPLVPPVVVESGRTSGFQVTDQIYRGTRYVGRFASSGLAGFKVLGGEAGVRVRVRLSIDNKAVKAWLKDAEGPEGPEGPEGSEDSEGAAGRARLPRLLQIRSQGTLRQCVVLDSREARRRPYATVEFDLAADEVPPDGLLCLEVADVEGWRRTPPSVREAVTGRVMPSSAVGVRIDRVEFGDVPAALGRPLPALVDGVSCEATSLVSAGGVLRGAGPGPRRLSGGIVVVNPPPFGERSAVGRIGLHLGMRGADARPRAQAAAVRRLQGVEGRLPKGRKGVPAAEEGRDRLLGARSLRVRRVVRRKARGVLGRLSAVPYSMAAHLHAMAVDGIVVLDLESGGEIPVRVLREGRQGLRLEFPEPLSSPALVVVSSGARICDRLVPSLVSVSRLAP